MQNFLKMDLKPGEKLCVYFLYYLCNYFSINLKLFLNEKFMFKSGSCQKERRKLQMSFINISLYSFIVVLGYFLIKKLLGRNLKLYSLDKLHYISS